MRVYTGKTVQNTAPLTETADLRSGNQVRQSRNGQHAPWSHFPTRVAGSLSPTEYLSPEGDGSSFFDDRQFRYVTPHHALPPLVK